MAKVNVKKVHGFFTHDIWHVKLENFSRWQRWFIRFARVILLGVRGYNEKNLVLQASALTLYSLLSVVPIVAMIFGIAQGFGLEAYLTEQLQKTFANQPDIMNNLLTYSHNMLSNTKGGLIAGLGFVLLLWSVVQVLGNIESAFNSIWFVRKSRTWSRKFTDYLSIMLVAPIFIILSGAANIFLSTEIKTFAEDIAFLGEGVKNLIIISINFVPYLTTSVLFFFVYLVMPNTRVKPKAAFAAGIIAGCVFQVFQWGYIGFQVGVSKYNAIYGSFASIPLFITWLQFSWIIVLVGAEISYCIQNITHVEGEKQTVDISHKMQMLYSLYIINFIAKRFKNAERAPDAGEIANKLSIPLNLCRKLIDGMLKCDLIAETIEEYNKEHCYTPALDIAHLKIGFIINKLESRGSLKPSGKSETLHHIKIHYNDLEQAMNASDSNKNITEF
jgi:membrane protein